MSKSKQSGILKSSASSNIALVKYWGKKNYQIPENPSVSLSLSYCKTLTEVSFEIKDDQSSTSEIVFYFEDKENFEFQQRVMKYLETLSSFHTIPKNIKLKINSRNTFPHSSGIASSASFMASLSLIIKKLDELINMHSSSSLTFAKEASKWARMGSGSACRSLFGPISLWGKLEGCNESSDEYAVPIKNYHDIFSNYRDTILIVDSAPKNISSQKGHQLMAEHPFKETRYIQARDNCHKIINAIKTGDLATFVKIVENEALMLHGLMMTGVNPYIMLKPNTLTIIDKITRFREKTQIPVAFTLDAGPNIHLLYPDRFHSEIMVYIQRELLQFLENRTFIEDKVSANPTTIEFK